MKFRKSILLFFAIFLSHGICLGQAAEGEGKVKNKNKMELGAKRAVSEEKPQTDITPSAQNKRSFSSHSNVYVGTSLIRQINGDPTDFLNRTVYLGFGKSRWTKSDLNLGLRSLSLDKKEFFEKILLDFTMRGYFSFFKSENSKYYGYAGLGIGLGYLPYYSDGITFNTQFFTGFRWHDLIDRFGFYFELNFAGFHPVFSKELESTGDISFNVGLIYSL